VPLAEAVAVGIAEGARLGPEDVSATMAFYDQSGEEMEPRRCTTGWQAGS
jgi:hypothetical protein